MKSYEKKRMIFIGSVLFVLLLGLQYFGYDNIYLTGALAGIVSGLSAVLYPSDQGGSS